MSDTHFYSIAFIQGVGGPELLIIFAIAFMLFGAKKLPELSRGIAQSVKEFRKIGKEIANEEES